MKTVTTLATLLALFTLRPALAAECLTQVDGITVQYDLPASEAIAGTQTGNQAGAATSAQAGAAPSRRATPAATTDTAGEIVGLRHTPPGRPGAPTGAGGELTHPVQGLPSNRQLTAGKRKEVQSLLGEARAADALGNEPKCMEFLKKAQEAVVKR